MAYHQTTPEDIRTMRVLQENKNARVVRPRGRGGKLQLVTNYQRKGSKTIDLDQQQAKWMIRGGLVAEHKRESTEDGRFFAITTRGRNYAQRDPRKVGSRTVTEGPSIKDLILKAVEKAGKDGVTAADLNLMLSSKYRIQTHYKTVGMTLFRLSKDKKVRRKGVIWYAIAPKTKKPAKKTTKAKTVDSAPVQANASPTVDASAASEAMVH